MDPVIFAKLCQKKQAEELFAAGVEGLAYCPKCGWINVCDPNDKLFRCGNPDCLKETCRQCKGDNHIPQRCEEVENDEELKNRKILEEKMSEAMIRQCYNCKTPYFKTQGCNHMTCPKCKKEMCYVCKRPYGKCKKDNKCFAYGGTTEQLHADEVKEAAEKAKIELGGKAKLKYDPTKNLPKPRGNNRNL